MKLPYLNNYYPREQIICKYFLFFFQIYYKRRCTFPGAGYVSLYIEIHTIHVSAEERHVSETRRRTVDISDSRRSVAFYWRSFEVHVIIHAGVLRKDGNDMGNKMCGGKKRDFMININVVCAATTVHQCDS